jgi:hypothetical protein
MNRLETSFYDTLPCVTFVNIGNGSDDSRHVWVCADATIAKSLADDLRDEPHITNVEVLDGTVKREGVPAKLPEARVVSGG